MARSRIASKRTQAASRDRSTSSDTWSSGAPERNWRLPVGKASPVGRALGGWRGGGSYSPPRSYGEGKGGGARSASGNLSGSPTSPQRAPPPAPPRKDGEGRAAGHL